MLRWWWEVHYITHSHFQYCTLEKYFLAMKYQIWDIKYEIVNMYLKWHNVNVNVNNVSTQNRGEEMDEEQVLGDGKDWKGGWIGSVEGLQNIPKRQPSLSPEVKYVKAINQSIVEIQRLIINSNFSNAVQYK